MITKFEKQVVALLLAATMCLAAVLSCGASAYAGEGDPVVETEIGESVVPSEEAPIASSEDTQVVPSEETPIVTSAGIPVTTSEENPIEESQNEADTVEGDVVESEQKVARASVTEGAYEYVVLEDDSVVISKYNGTETEVSVPGTLGGKTVSSIGELAFGDNQTIEKVTLPASVTSIQYFSFGGCTNLKNVELLGNNLKTIGNQAFLGSGLTGFAAPSAETVGIEAFRLCEDLDNVVFGAQLKSLGERAFASSGIRSIQISESGLSRIEIGTFSDCKNLSQITLPNSVKSIGAYAFYYSGLETIKIPNSVEVIEDSAFFGCQKLETAELSNFLKRIGAGAFGYSGLLEIEIPDSVVEIGGAAFSGCQRLASATIGNGVTVVGGAAFAECALTTVTIGKRVEVIDDYAFAENRELSKVVIPQNVTRLEYAAFVDCEALADITFPDVLTKIEGRALDGTAWYAGQMDGVVYAGKVLYQYKGDMPMGTSVKLRDGTRGIAAFAFSECKNLKEIEIPEGVTNIGRFAFYDAGPMSSVRIPESVKEVGQMALGYFESPNGTYFSSDHGTGGRCEKIPDFTIYGRAGSSAQKYAEENGFIFVPDKDNFDDNTGKEIAVNSGELDFERIREVNQLSGDVIITVELSQDTPSAEVDNQLTQFAKNKGYSVFASYEISLILSADGKKVNITENFGKLKLTFNIGSSLAGKEVVVYQLHNAEVIEHDAQKGLTVNADGTVTITVDRFSTFAVAVKDEPNTDGDDSNQTGGNQTNTGAQDVGGQNADQIGANEGNTQGTPKTGDSANPIIWVTMIMVTLTALVIISRKRYRKI